MVKARYSAPLEAGGCIAVTRSVAVALATTVGFSVCAASPARAASASLEFCPYLPYLAKGSSQIVQDDYTWRLYQVDPAGQGVLQQQGRDRGCHIVSPVGNAAYRVGLQTDCDTGGTRRFRLSGESPTVWVSEDPAPVRVRVDAGWTDC